MNWIPAARSWCIARWEGAARRRSRSCSNQGSPKCLMSRAGLLPGPSASILRCRSTEEQLPPPSGRFQESAACPPLYCLVTNRPLDQEETRKGEHDCVLPVLFPTAAQLLARTG